MTSHAFFASAFPFSPLRHPRRSHQTKEDTDVSRLISPFLSLSLKRYRWMEASPSADEEEEEEEGKRSSRFGTTYLVEQAWNWALGGSGNARSGGVGHKGWQSLREKIRSATSEVSWLSCCGHKCDLATERRCFEFRNNRSSLTVVLQPYLSGVGEEMFQCFHFRMNKGLCS